MTNAPSPLFSIVTACKNGLKFLEETTQSILGQDCAEWEWVFIDDCSDEPIEDFLKSLQDPRIRYFRNDVPRGQTKSLNFGIQQSRAPWIVRMDGDDIAHSEKLSATLEVIRSNSDLAPLLLFSDYDVIHENGSYIGTVRYHSPIDKNFYWYLESKNNPICHPTVTFSRVYPDGSLVQYDERLNNAQDYALWKRFALAQENAFCHIPQPLLRYRLVTQSLSGLRAGEQREELQKIRNAQIESRSNGNALTLDPRQQVAMYAYRTLYYRFLSASKPSKIPGDLALLTQAAGYSRVFWKSLAFFVARLWPKPIKQILFLTIYQ